MPKKSDARLRKTNTNERSRVGRALVFHEVKDFGGDGAADYDGSDETEDVVVVDVLRGVPKHAMKKADKKAKFLERIRKSGEETTSSLNALQRLKNTNNKIQKKVSSTRKKRKTSAMQFGLADFAKDLGASLEHLKSSTKTTTKMKKTTSKKREVIARVENERMRMVLKHPQFKENPMQAVLTHLTAQLEKDDGDSYNKAADVEKHARTNNNNDRDKSKTSEALLVALAENEKKKKRKMTPAQLRKIQGDHHSGPRNGAKKSLHRDALKKNANVNGVGKKAQSEGNKKRRNK